MHHKPLDRGFSSIRSGFEIYMRGNEPKKPFPIGDQYVLFVSEMTVERRAANIRTIDNVLHRYRVVVFFDYQLDQCTAEGRDRTILSSIRGFCLMGHITF